MCTINTKIACTWIEYSRDENIVRKLPEDVKFFRLPTIIGFIAKRGEMRKTKVYVYGCAYLMDYYQYFYASSFEQNKATTANIRGTHDCL
jgi:hypothetical protein